MRYPSESVLSKAGGISETMAADGNASHVVGHQVRRAPSAFANEFQDHFPKSSENEPDQVSVHRF